MSAPRLAKLHRSYNNRIIAGVMGGIAEYLGWSPFLTRLLFVIIVLVKPRRTLLSENFHTPMDSFHCWLYEAV